MIPVVVFKPGVTLVPSSGGTRILSVLDQYALHVGENVTVTAGTNGHRTGKHVVGEAFDLSVRDLEPDQILHFLAYLRDHLGRLFYVQYETPTAPTDPGLRRVAVVSRLATFPHVHVQVRKGTTFPPTERILKA